MSEIDPKIMEQMQKDFDAIQMPRSPFALRNLVVNARFTPQQAWAQMVLEMQIAYNNLRTAKAQLRIKEIEIEELQGKAKTETDQLNIDIKIVEKEQLQYAMLGALREFECLYSMWKENPNHYTRAELNNAQPLEYERRLMIQAQQDLNATGRVSQGNQEGLRQIGKMTYPELDIARSVEQRYLEGGKQRMMIAVPTEFKAENGLACLDGVEYPAGIEIKIFNCFDRKVADAYNEIVRVALEDKCDWLFTAEDDQVLEKTTLTRLFEEIKKQPPKTILGAFYVKKEESRQGAHIEIVNGVRQGMVDDGTVKDAYTICQGATLFPMSVFMEVPYPWFMTTAQLSQDSFFSQLAREHGWSLKVDTANKVGHKDRISHKIYY